MRPCTIGMVCGLLFSLSSILEMILYQDRGHPHSTLQRDLFKVCSICPPNEHFYYDGDPCLSKPSLHPRLQLAIIKHVTRQESRSSAGNCHADEPAGITHSAGPDHVTLQALITWLIKSRSRDCACTDDVADRALITWLIMH